jgi:hypothetical protein
MSGQSEDWEEDFAEIRRRQMASRMNTKASLVEGAWNQAIQTAAKFDESVLSTIVLAYAYDPRAPLDELHIFLSPYMSNSVEWYPPDSDDVTTDHRTPSWFSLLHVRFCTVYPKLKKGHVEATIIHVLGDTVTIFDFCPRMRCGKNSFSQQHVVTKNSTRTELEHLLRGHRNLVACADDTHQAVSHPDAPPLKRQRRA